MTELKLQQSLLDGRYEILECLGRGSYAEIYVARDLSAADGEPQTVVIKVLNVLLQGMPDRDLERTLIENFQNEAVALDRVRHPHIISRLGHGTAIDLAGTAFHYIVLEYLAGGELGARIRQQPFTLERALFYLEQICSGLAYAHECGVIHRDIKPQNLLLTADAETVKIADFGVAKIEASEGAITRVGTNVYAAPEHNPLVQTGPLDTASLPAHQPHLTPAADIYSLAKTTYTLLAGEPPRRFSHHRIKELPESIASKAWAADVLRVLKRATEDKPGDRYQTVQEFWQELSDASLPPTQPLNPQDGGDELRERPASKQLTGKTGSLVEAPPRPRFDSPGINKESQMGANGNNRPRIVVPISVANKNLNFPAQPPMPRQRRPARETIVAGAPPAPHPQSAENYAAAQQVQTKGRSFRALIALAIILAFAGILLATHFYVSRQRASSPPTAVDPSSEIGREGIVKTDVRLRPDPSTNNRSFGIVTQGSRARVLNVKNSWYEIEVLQQGRDDPSSANRGWINKRFLDDN
jgi:serine/threonine protein kinase